MAIAFAAGIAFTATAIGAGWLAFRGPGRWFASHPPVEDRVARLRRIGREIGQIF